MLTIQFPTKLTSTNFEPFIKKYYKKSFIESSINFELAKLEWIAIEQITFLISWINNLSDQQKKVSVFFQTDKDVYHQKDVYSKREKCYNYLMVDWRLSELLDSRVTYNSPSYKIIKRSPRPIPYHELSLLSYNANTFDNDFDELYETYLKGFVEYIEQQIKSNTLLNYFDNHFLHYSIIKEFFSNACQHAFDNPIGHYCSFSLSSNNQIEKLYGDLLDQKLNERFAERPFEEQQFFKNGDVWINNSFIEFNFLDFGNGIAKTLKNKYLAEDFSKVSDKLSSRHLFQNEDTRVLEYAFLLFTSKYELADDLSLHNYIPRGLFIIKDVVKRYQGMIIARSGRGKVVFNFKNESIDEQVIFREDDNANEIGDGFNGTSFTIVLPAITKQSSLEKKFLNSIHNHEKQQLSFFNLLEYTRRIEHLVENDITDQTEKRVRFLELFFKKIVTDFLELNNKDGDLILIDFAGVERSSQDIFSKFLYFLTYCPLISEIKNIALFNLIDKGISFALLENDNEKLRSKGFIPRTIPCIFPDNQVAWIGINNPVLENQLTLVWKEDYSKNDTRDDIRLQANNVVVVDYVRSGTTYFSIKIKPFYDIIKEILEFQQRMIHQELTEHAIHFKELKNEERDYNVVLTIKYDIEGRQRAFLTANGKFQKEFLTFIEKLYIREYRRLIATYLIFNLYANTKTEEEINIINQADKILTVTLSSQLLGKEFTDILNDLQQKKEPARLIPLSNYYDFNTEEPFKEINENDKIIVVNDVISTGNLSQKLVESVKNKNSEILSILAIVDSRTDTDRVNKVDLITPIIQRKIKKYDTNPFDTVPIWINPILNAPTTMSRVKSNIDSILKSPQEFINLFNNDQLFKVGHFQQNTRYLTYYLQTNNFFKEEQKSGFLVLSKIMEALESKIRAEKKRQLKDDLTDLKRIKSTYSSRFRQLFNGSIIAPEAIEESLDALDRALTIESQENNYQPYSDTRPIIDFIFYPFLSSVAEIEKNINPISTKLRGNHTIEIYPLPRIMTPRGWRFSFPPKFLNFRTKDQTALILDDGSCTGETIYQMIDSLSFLELREIFVLSIFGRLEDFQREFLSRIKLLKVKDKSNNYKQIPVTVFFGTHFHIPVYSKASHPTNQELEELQATEAYYTRQEAVIPKHIDNYLRIRRSQISVAVNPDLSDKQFSIIPSYIDKRLMFFIRDLAGNFDSYRLFKEDEIDYQDQSEGMIFQTFNGVVKHNDGKNALLAVLTMEPFLTNSINRLYPEVLAKDIEENTRSFALEQLATRQTIEDIYFYLVSLMAIDVEIICEVPFLRSVFEKLKEFGESAVPVLEYIGYTFTTLIFQTRKGVSDRISNAAKVTIQTFYIDNNSEKTHDEFYSSLLKELYNESLTVVDDFPQNPQVKSINKVKTYYRRQLSNFDGYPDSNHPNSYVAISSIINRLNAFRDRTPPSKELEELYKDIEELCDHVASRLFNDLKKVLEFLKQFFDNFNLGIDIPNYLEIINQFARLRESLKNKNNFINKTLSKEQVSFVEWLLKFQSAFFKHTTKLPQFFTRDISNLKEILLNSISKQDRTPETLKIQLSVPDEIHLGVHPYLLGIIFFEIARNKVKYALEAEAEISAKIDRRHAHILYKQKQKFKENSNENGLITIRNIVKQYGGKTFTRADENSYEFEIILNKDLIL